MSDLFGDDIVPGKSPGVLRDDVRFIFEHWKKVMDKRSICILDKNRKIKIIGALKLGYTVDFLCKSIDGCALDDWYMGRHPQNKVKHNEICLILRDAIHIEKFEAIASAKEAKVKKVSAPDKPRREIWEIEGCKSYDEWFEKKYGVKPKNHEEIKAEIQNWVNRGKLLREKKEIEIENVV